MNRLIAVGLIVVAACAHGSARAPDAPPQSLVSWTNELPLAAHELCAWVGNHPQDALRWRHLVQDQRDQVANALVFAATHPATMFPAGTLGETNPAAGWQGDIAPLNDRVMQTLIAWASRHPDAAQQLEPQTLEWIASHQRC